MRAKNATVPTSPRVILAPGVHSDASEQRMTECLRALVRVLARQAARDYCEEQNGTIRTRSEE